MQVLQTFVEATGNIDYEPFGFAFLKASSRYGNPNHTIPTPKKTPVNKRIIELNDPHG